VISEAGLVCYDAPVTTHPELERKGNTMPWSCDDDGSPKARKTIR
jgi:hypothetical protein